MKFPYNSYFVLFTSAIMALLYASPASAYDPITFVIENESKSNVLNIMIDGVDKCVVVIPPNSQDPLVSDVGFITFSISPDNEAYWPNDNFKNFTVRKINKKKCGDARPFTLSILDADSQPRSGDFKRKFTINKKGEIRPNSGGQDIRGVFKQGEKEPKFVWNVLVDLPSHSNLKIEAKFKRNKLEQYAPNIWLAKGEKFKPSSVDWAFKRMNRVRRGPKNPYFENYWLYTKSKLTLDDTSLPFFKGQDVGDAKIYGFWTNKIDGGADLVYFVFYPYNHGKQWIIGPRFGSHVGDWEKMIVRLDKDYKPTSAFLSAHTDTKEIPWFLMRMTATEEERPIVYAAMGSHGFWQTPDAHEYKKINIPGLKGKTGLLDLTSQGTLWKTHDDLEAYDYDSKQSLDGKSWPLWMRDNISGDETPGSGSIYRWGNGKTGCGGLHHVWERNRYLAIGECRQNDGPTGPKDKSDAWEKSVYCFPEAEGGLLHRLKFCAPDPSCIDLFEHEKRIGERLTLCGAEQKLLPTHWQYRASSYACAANVSRIDLFDAQKHRFGSGVCNCENLTGNYNDAAVSVSIHLKTDVVELSACD